eukprot:TRINITY_DN4068_c0_g1_i1.p1 TRINITY_DN4068_c0_g1~~TRINITY_DN4068_c0_g1_i1.p1  ORF type:complete len:189 (-),score=18.89 TRINITY_DN4068_c0_g1_i1:21-587(-)
MRWHKLKQLVERSFAPVVAGKVKIWSTKYRKPLDQIEGLGRIWLTKDKTTIYSFCSHTKLQCLKRELSLQEQGLDPTVAEASANETLLNLGVFSQEECYTSLLKYVNTSIEDCISSPDPIVKGFGMLDKRLDIKRIQNLSRKNRQQHVFVGLMLILRCNLEAQYLQTLSIEAEKEPERREKIFRKKNW